MNLMISTTSSRPAPAAKNANPGIDILSYAIGECALGRVLVARSDRGVCAILIGDMDEDLTDDLANRFPEAELIANEIAVHDDLAKVILFVKKPPDGLHLTLDMRGTPFQRRVWEELCAIPAGKTTTYMELARHVGAQTSPRAVGAACAANPIALAIPCHRVVRSDGDLAGYRWGIERKRELLRKEAIA
jgi:O-6-methylguanine DNA methyltransferase